MAFARMRMKAAIADKPPRYLILTNTGGNGHIQTARTVERQLLSTNPDAQVDVIDVFEDFLGKIHWGGFLAEQWNGVQRSGNIALQAFYISSVPFINIPPLFFPSI